MQTHPPTDVSGALITYPIDLSDAEWDYLESLVPAPKSGEGKKGQPANVDQCALINAMFYITRAGCAWRYLTEECGSSETVYGYYRTWKTDWTWKFIHDTLRDYLRNVEGRPVAPAAALIDRQSVKVPDQAGGTRLRRRQEGVGAQAPPGGGLPGGLILPERIFKTGFESSNDWLMVVCALELVRPEFRFGSAHWARTKASGPGATTGCGDGFDCPRLDCHRTSLVLPTRGAIARGLGNSSQPSVKTLYQPILSGFLLFDITGLHLVLRQPALYDRGDDLRAMCRFAAWRVPCLP